METPDTLLYADQIFNVTASVKYDCIDCLSKPKHS